MNNGKTVFSQLIDYVPFHEFQKCVNRYKGNYKVKSFTCWEQFLVMAFAQLTYRESLRDIETCLRAMQSKLYHMGIKSKISRSTISDANETRDFRIYQDFAHVLITHARDLYKDDNEFISELNSTVYALDATTIDLCLSLFPWAHFREHKGAVKMHTLLDLNGNIPSFIKVTTGLVHEVNILDELPFEPGAYYIMDRGYIDFERLYNLNLSHAFFITRAKTNFDFRRIYSNTVDRKTGLICDQTISLSGFYSSIHYPDKLRRIKYFDEKTEKNLTFLTNNFILKALVVAQLYKERWQIELFFKWIKQHLRIKSFYGTSENAVKTQIWIAVSIYLLVAIVKKKLKINLSLYTFLQILSVSIFERTPILQLVNGIDYTNFNHDPANQLNLFNL
ncbi:MAG: IS4 family transposase [Ignavibacteria bacterium]|nr:IS4 family transposase [Ignavibacteria bacterium]MCU7520074.1 IS4 family transposase [Ignavibacteria bacterium]